MTPGEFREFARTMREFGLTRAKIGDVVMVMAGAQASDTKPAQVTQQVTQAFVAPEQEPIKHKVEQLASLMKLSDTELVDELFPDHTQDEVPA
jgi:hypothetical protein